MLERPAQSKHLHRTLAPRRVFAKVCRNFIGHPLNGTEQEKLMAVDGKWNITIKTPMGDQNGTLTLKQDGDALTGSMSGAQGDAPIEDGKVEGDKLTWKSKITTPMPMTLEFEGLTEGDVISGNVKLGAFGMSTFSGTAV